VKRQQHADEGKAEEENGGIERRKCTRVVYIGEENGKFYYRCCHGRFFVSLSGLLLSMVLLALLGDHVDGSKWMATSQAQSMFARWCRTYAYVTP
jgi:hypothetical protein